MTGLISSGYLSHVAEDYRWQTDPRERLSGRDAAHSPAKDRKAWKSSLWSYVSVAEDKSGEERHVLHDFPKQHKCTVKDLDKV